MLVVHMHHDQLDVPMHVVERLVAKQFPRWAQLPMQAIASAGTVNALFRLGDQLVVRLPLQPSSPAQARSELLHEQENARRLLGRVSIAVPEPVALGEPGLGYPMPWSVYRWIEGQTSGPHNGGDSTDFARALAAFVAEVRALDNSVGVFDGRGRGGQLMAHDSSVGECAARSRGLIDTEAILRVWTRLRLTPRTNEPDRWTHGDLMPGNLLARGGALVGVIDVGGLGFRDPAVDLAPAWNLFTPSARETFRVEVDVAQDVWDRGKAWSLIQGINALYYYTETNPPMADTARRALQAILDDEDSRN